ncbi:MAG TPA: c-type cytochrome [Terriglobales bacterium]|nr:c-type cytochrome [Terriglobales bacterium]
MKNFILGIIVALGVLIVGGLGWALLGYMPTSADESPRRFEARLANMALDAAMERRAPRATSPLPPTDENLIAGMKLYTMNCAGCHGGLDRKPAAFGASFYPPAPQLIVNPVDDPEWHVFYAVRTGVRYTGMPAWGKTLSEPDIWKITAFLVRVEKLPPAAQDFWKKSTGTEPPATESGDHKDHHE